MSENAKLQLIEFLSWAAEKGMMKKTTASAIKAACNAVLSVLDEGESADVTNINLETVFHRYENLHGFDVAPATMKAYRQRVSYAVEEFRKYNENKSGWKPSGGQRTNSSQPRSKKGSQNNRPNDGNDGNDGIDHNPNSNIDEVSKITHRFPLRRDLVVSISGIPFDVKKAEMARLTAFLSNLVPGDEESPPLRPMLNASPDNRG